MSKKNRKRKSEDENQSPIDWEEENIISEEIKNEMKSMWEVDIFIVINFSTFYTAL